MYTLDTNTVLHYFKGLNHIKTTLLSKSPQELSIPIIVLYELEVGTIKSDAPQKRRKLLNTFLEHIAILPFTRREAEVAAEVRALLEQQGTPIGPLDVLIAGTALAQGVTLVTHNTKEFSRIQGLQLEDWY